MTILLRRIIFITFVVVYFVTTTAVLLYGSGYTFGVFDGVFTKTGILFVKTEPKDATIFVNNIIRGNKTPRRIPHLKPGLYQIRIEYKGYSPWEKTLEIKAGETTFVTDVVLWKKTLPSLVYSSDVPFELLADNDNALLAHATSSTFEIVSLATDDETPHTWYRSSRTQPFERTIILSPDKQRGLVTTYNLETQSLDATIIPFSDSEKQIAVADYFPPTTTKKIVWHNNTGWLLFIEDAQQRIWRFNVLDHSLKYLADGTLLGVDEPHLYLLKPHPETDKHRMVLVSFNMTTEREQIINEFGEQETIEYVASQKYLSLLKNTRAQNMMLFNVKEEHLSALPLQDTVTLVTSPDSRVYAYHTPHELWITAYDKENVLLWRTSETIRDVSFIGKNNYLIVRTDEKMRIVELDVRDEVNMIDMPFPSQTSKPLINDNGDELFVSSVLGTQKGIFRLELR